VVKRSKPKELAKLEPKIADSDQRFGELMIANRILQKVSGILPLSERCRPMTAVERTR
jgi:hypothetical protein